MSDLSQSVELSRTARENAGCGASLEDYGSPCATEESLREAFREGAVVSLYDAEASFGQFDARFAGYCSVEEFTSRPLKKSRFWIDAYAPV